MKFKSVRIPVMILLSASVLFIGVSSAHARRRHVIVFGACQTQGDPGDVVRVVGTYEIDNPENTISLQQADFNGELPYTTTNTSGDVYTESESGVVCVAGYLTLNSNMSTAGQFSVFEVPCE